MPGDSTKPKILSVRTAARSKLFEIESVRLRFENGLETEFERVSSSPIYGAVVVVPMLDPATFMLVKEYAVGFDRYEVGLPKGLVHGNESLLAAANRELMEETGYKAKRLSKLYTLTVAAGFLCYATDVVLALDLESSGLKQGDEPEPLEVIEWSVTALDELITSNYVTDARSVAALYLARSVIQSNEFLERERALPDCVNGLP
jgi:ADP-ribose diphosphatase